MIHHIQQTRWHLSISLALVMISLAATAQQSNPTGHVENTGYQVQIVPAINNTWCFVIRLDDKRFIHQVQLPGQPADGYKTMEEANTAAKEAIEKIKSGAHPRLKPMERNTKVTQKS